MSDPSTILCPYAYSFSYFLEIREFLSNSLLCVLLRGLLRCIDETLRLHPYMLLFGTFHNRSESGPVEVNVSPAHPSKSLGRM